MDDEQLQPDIDRLSAGDEDALQRLIVHYHAVLWKRLDAKLRNAGGERLDPDDILQQAYIAAFKSLGDCQFANSASFYVWLERIVDCRSIDEQKAMHRQKRDVRRNVAHGGGYGEAATTVFGRIAAPDSTPSKGISREESHAIVLSSLARLSDNQRTVVRGRFLENRSVADLAEALGKTENAIHQLCSRGIATLRRLLALSTG